MVLKARVSLLPLTLLVLVAGLALARQDEDPGPEADSDRRVERLGDEAGEEYELDLSVPRPAPGPRTGDSGLDLPDADQNAELKRLLASLAARPGHRPTLSRLDELLSQVLTQADQAMLDGRYDEAARMLGVIRNVNPRKSGLGEASRRLDRFLRIEGWLEEAALAREEERYLDPPGESALDLYNRILAVDPDNAGAKRGLLQVQQALVGYALAAARNLDFESAETWLEHASRVREPQDLVDEAREKIAQFHEQQAVDIELEIIAAMNRGDFDQAEARLIDLIALGVGPERVAMLRERLWNERMYGTLSPGQIIQDRFQDTEGTAPAVVVVAAGSFMMGSPPDEHGRSENEGPRHRVLFTNGFALGMQEVTVSQFRSFIEATGYQTEAEAAGSSRIWDEALGRLMKRERISWRRDFEGNLASGSLPVMHVSWNDAQAYVRWLSQATGQSYRLPSEAEFEYTQRAGTTTRYWWGEYRPPDAVENLTGEEDESSTGRRWSVYFRGYGDGHWGPAPGGSFRANPFGLFDMAGNVSEWVQDCWHSNYVRAPANGRAWENPGCERRVVRGGYWASAPEQARSAARLSAASDLTGPRVGFRVARDL